MEALTLSFPKSYTFHYLVLAARDGAVVRALDVARVQIPASTPYMGWVCCWFSPLLREFFSAYSGFPISSKTHISKFQFDQESGRRRTTLWMCYLQVIIYLSFISFFQMTLNKISTSFLWALNNFFTTIIYEFSLVLFVITHYVIKL